MRNDANSDSLIHTYRPGAPSIGPPAGIRHAATGALREFTNVGGGRQGAAEREDFSESNYDEWSGYGGNIYHGANTSGGQRATAGFTGVDDAEDNEAD